MKKPTQDVKTVASEAEVDYEEPLYAVKSPTGRIPPLKVQVLLDDCEVLMQIDTGASCLRACLGAFGLRESYKILALSYRPTLKSHFR